MSGARANGLISGQFGTAVLIAVAIFPSFATAENLRSEATNSLNKWTGIHLDLNIGAGAAVQELSATIDPIFDTQFNGIGAEGFLAEIGIGADYQINNRFVVGVGAAVNWSTIATTLDIAVDGAIGPGFEAGLDYDLSANLGYDIYARAGILVSPSTLAYVRGGYSWQTFKGELGLNVGIGGSPAFGFDTSYDLDFQGWTVGAGLETQLTANISAKVEYIFKQFEGNSYLFDVIEIEPSMHQAKFGLSYRLGAQSYSNDSQPDFNAIWTGFHVGVDVGGGVPIHQLNGYFGGIIPNVNATSKFNGIGGEGFTGSVRVGYDHEFGKRWVAGIAASANWSTMATTLDVSIPIISGEANYEMVADFGYDVVARIGMRTNDNLLVYALGGYSYQNFDAKFEIPGLFSTSYDLEFHGWTVGAGFEAALTERLFAHLEYRYTDYMEEKFLFDIIGVEPSSHNVRAGLSYKFSAL